MVSLGLYLVVTCLICTCILGFAKDCSVQKFELNGLCCDYCPKGSYVTKLCSEDQPTLCSPCEDGYYSEQSNPLTSCVECDTCQHNYTEKCTKTTNAKCSCRSGFLCSDHVCSKCEERKCCKTGEVLVGSGTQKGGDSTQLMIAAGFLISSLILFIYPTTYACTKVIRQHKAEKCSAANTSGVSPEICDCHLSKEESGCKLIYQDDANSIHVSQIVLEDLIV
ncbi:tumor necrosis factor receptor superfamily member 26-like [Lampris incognitus]|uniref:tumor necrosis factor receptor superfamily member 26-like n=1 Tax=Lampris incognitus TaxID=2546036 RepID=UPI0024B629F1|nr:tumor necrosis factor receptor superfamily member 26-like [Lampris incognitus]